MTNQDFTIQEAEISLLFENARAELDAIDELAKEDKKKVVKDLAKCLEGRIRTDTICVEIVNQLRGRVSERFVRECLEEKYKHQQKMQNARMQKKKRSQEQIHNESLAALTPLNQEQEGTANKEVVITQSIDGISIEQQEPQKNPEPSSINLADTKAADLPLGLKDQSKHGLKECSRCKQRDSEICELREALSRQTTLITANEISSYEIKFTIPKEKYPSLEEAMQSSRNSITIVFDRSGLLERAVSDFARRGENK